MATLDELYLQSDRDNGLPQGFTRAIAQAETGHISDPLKRASIVSPKGAQGWMQLIPQTAARYGVKNPMDMEQSILGGGRYLGDLMKQFGKPHLVAAAYNAGEGNVQKYGGIPPFEETQKYVPKVMSGLQGSDPFDSMKGNKMGADPFDGLENQRAKTNVPDPFDDLPNNKPFKVLSKEDPPIDLTNPNASFADNFMEGFSGRSKDRMIGLKQALNIGDPQELAHQVRLRKLENESIEKSAGGKTGQIAADIGGGLALGSLAAPAALSSPIWGLPAAAVGGAVSGLLEPTESRDEAEKKISQGAVGGLLGAGAGHFLAKAANPISSKLGPEAKRLADLAVNKYGIDLTPAMLTGSKPLKWIDAVLADMPGTAGKQQAINEGMQKQFNRAISRTWDGTEDTLTPDVINAAKNRVGGVIDDLAERNSLKFDRQLQDELSALRQSAADKYTDSNASALNAYIKDLESKVQSGEVSGQAYRRLRTEINNRIKSTSDGDLKNLLGDYKKSISSGMERSISPEDWAAWQKANRDYGAVKTVQPLAEKATVGDIGESLLLNQANKGTNEDLKNLGRIGKEFLRDMPNSGTQQRTMMQQLINHPLSVLAASPVNIPSKILLQNLIHSNAGKKWLTQGLLSEEGAKKAAQTAGLLGMPLGTEFASNLPLLWNTGSQE